MSGRSSVRRPDGDRAQTGIDLLVAMSVFLIAVGFVFAFVPSMFAPFGVAKPGVLSTVCTAAFFDVDEALAESNDCNINPDEIDDLNALFGVPDWKNVQVTIGEPGTVDWDGETIELRRGADPSTDSDTVSQRIVSIEGEPYELTVRVW